MARILLLLLCLVGTCWAEPDAPLTFLGQGGGQGSSTSVGYSGSAYDPAAEIAWIIDDFMRDSQGFHGVVLVARGETILHEKAYGLASADPKRPMTTDALFDWASISKNFTATAMLRLQMDRKLDLDHPLRKYAPEVPASHSAITLRHLLNHTTGFGHEDGPDQQGPPPASCPSDDYPGKGEPKLTQKDLIEEFLALKKKAEPGKRFEYLNPGYNVAAVVVERVSGKPFAEFVRDELLKRAGMTSSSVLGLPEVDRSKMPRLGGGTCRLTGLPEDQQGGFVGTSGVLATARDMWRWDRALRDGRILDDASLKQLYTPALEDYALGWTVEAGPDEVVWRHSGSLEFMNSILLRGAQSQIVVAIAMTQEEDPERRNLAHLAEDLFLAAGGPESGGPP